MKIKDVEKQVGISKANIRFYEEEGLILSLIHILEKSEYWYNKNIHSK